MSTVDCPYCEKSLEISTDDGYGLDEGQQYQQECPHCEKFFVYTTCINISHDAYQADCLNGSSHILQPMSIYPEAFGVGKFRCSICGEEETNKEQNESAIKAYFATKEF